MARSQGCPARSRSAARDHSPVRDHLAAGYRPRTAGLHDLTGGRLCNNWSQVSALDEIDYDEVLVSLKGPSCHTKNYKVFMANAMIRQGGVFGEPCGLRFITYGTFACFGEEESKSSYDQVTGYSEKNASFSDAADAQKAEEAASAAGKVGTHAKEADRDAKEADDPFFFCTTEIPYESLSVKAKGIQGKKSLATAVKGGIYGSEGDEYGFISWMFVAKLKHVLGYSTFAQLVVFSFSDDMRASPGPDIHYDAMRASPRPDVH